MNTSGMKNMIVVRNLPSNIIEEAFIILKPNQKIKVQNTINIKGEINKTKEIANEYVVKEAEMVISDYLSNLESKKGTNGTTITKLENRYKKLRTITFFLGFVIMVFVLGKIM